MSRHNGWCVFVVCSAVRTTAGASLYALLSGQRLVRLCCMLCCQDNDWCVFVVCPAVRTTAGASLLYALLSGQLLVRLCCMLCCPEIGNWSRSSVHARLPREWTFSFVRRVTVLFSLWSCSLSLCTAVLSMCFCVRILCCLYVTLLYWPFVCVYLLCVCTGLLFCLSM